MEKLQKYFFYLLLILLPTQLGWHLWPAWSYVSGVRVDYLSPTLYLTDILIGALFAFEVFFYLRHSGLSRIADCVRDSGCASRRTERYISSHTRMTVVTAGLLFVCINVYFSLSPFESVYKWLRVAEFGFLVYWAARCCPTVLLSYCPTILLIPVFYESILAMWQFVVQGSVGGWWYFLGERTFNSSTAGIANAVINGQLVLRPYGTLPHPNVLAGFLVVSCLLVLGNLTHISRKITAVVLGLGVLVLFLTPSRGDIWHGLSLRQQLNNIAVAQWLKSPIVGTGLGTSPLYQRNITNFALLHQPIHNIYLLVLSETGFIGLVLFLFLIYLAVQSPLAIIRNTLYVILILGLFDHYFLTIQQGQLVLSLILGMALGRMNKVKNKGGEY